MFSGGVRWHSSCVLFHYVVMVLGVSGGLVAFILSHVVIVLVVSGALWPPHWYYLTTPKHDYHDSRVLGWISGSILGHLGCHGPPNGTNFRSQVLGELACSGHLEACWHSSFSLVASYIPGFIFLVLYSWLYIPGFVFALYFCICIPGLIFLVVDSCFYSPGFTFPDLSSWFIFLADLV